MDAQILYIKETDNEGNVNITTEYTAIKIDYKWLNSDQTTPHRYFFLPCILPYPEPTIQPVKTQNDKLYREYLLFGGQYEMDVNAPSQLIKSNNSLLYQLIVNFKYNIDQSKILPENIEIIEIA